MHLQAELIVIAALTAFLVCFVTTPLLVRFAYRFNWLDKANARKIHSGQKPTSGGIAIFAGIATASVFTIDWSGTSAVVAASLSGMFLLGFLDDKTDLSARLKFVIQLLAALAMAAAGIRLENLHGILGLYQLSLPVQYLLTMLIIIGVTNAYNLIDGVDGLAAGLALIAFTLFGWGFCELGRGDFAVFCFAMSAALAAFLCYNFNPARLFMGDTGSLVIGFGISTAAIFLFQLQAQQPKMYWLNREVIAAAMLLPIIDTLKVFAVRMASGRSPFSPDKSHIHHLLMELGLGHRQVCLVLYGFTLLLCGTMIFKPQAEVNVLIALMLAANLSLYGLLYAARAWKKAGQARLRTLALSRKSENNPLLHLTETHKNAQKMPLSQRRLPEQKTQ